MKIRNFKINGPLFLGLVLAATLVSCHNEHLKRNNDKKEEVKQYFNIPEVQIDDVFTPSNIELEDINSEDYIQKRR